MDASTKQFVLSRLNAKANRPPLAPRVPLWIGDAEIGSVEADFFARALPANGIGPNAWVAPHSVFEVAGWQLQGQVTESLASIAQALRDNGFVHAWRDEQLAIRDDQGVLLGTVERGVVRQLGITTQAVHLVGATHDGRLWSQQRSYSKSTDPGLWDTMMGGMVSAADTREQALARETLEEAGLRIDEDLQHVARHGRITTRRPSDEHPAGYVVEHIDWYSCLVPLGVKPRNQDGEVAQFILMDQQELEIKLLTEAFTTEASLILVEYGVLDR